MTRIKMRTVRSFDVFDTCLIRKMALPSDIFYEVAQKVLTMLAIAPVSPYVEDFVAARVNAERIAREHSGREDVTLDEIWRNLIRAMGWQYDDSLARCELETEEELLVPVSTVSKQVQAARQQGCRIIFVSDMYLPGEFIKRQLVKHGFAEPGDGFYVSGDIGKTKASGNLFSHLLAQENVVASELWHTGDNQHSDYAVPRRLGIRAELFSGSRLTDAEMSVVQTGQHPRAANRIAGAMRAFRLGCEAEERREINELTSQFIGPFVTGFATWVLQRAREDGVKRLYFMSRDCQLVWKAARELSPRFDGIDCRYLYVSRQALSLPSANAISPEGMPWMRRPFEKPVLKNLLAKIELKFEDVQSGLADLAGAQEAQFQLESERDWQRFWEALNEEPVKKRITEVIATRRETAKQYFENAGLLDDVPWAIVDLGWYLSCQRSLWEVLKHFGWRKQIRGYYLALKNQRIGYLSAGQSEALIYEQPIDSQVKMECTVPFSYETLLEHIIGYADHPTVHHYELGEGGKSCPAFSGVMTERAVDFCGKLHDQTLDFIRENQMLADVFSDATVCRESLILIARSFFKNPSELAAKSIEKLAVATDQNGLDVAPLMRPLDTGTALIPLLPRRGPFESLWKTRDSLWPEGAMAITPMPIRRLSNSVEWLAKLRGKARRILIG
jgi:predicted HAD superfamily hydrolase